MNDNDFICNNLEKISISNSFLCTPEDSLRYIGHKDTLNFLHVNIRSINHNFNELITLTERVKINLDIIVLSECWLSKCQNIPQLPGFDFYKTSFTNQNDGVVVYVRKGLDCNITYPDFPEANCLTIKFQNKLAILAMYRSPSYRNTNPFLNNINDALNDLKEMESVCIIGDININISPGVTDSMADDYLNLLASHGMLPAHTLPTRGTNCLDHVMLRTSHKTTTLVLDTLITDHAPVLVNYQIKTNTLKTPHTLRHTDFTAVSEELRNYDFSNIFRADNVDTATDQLIDTVSTVINKYTSTKVVTSKKRILKPWITPGLLRCIRHRDKLYSKYKKNTDDELHKTMFLRYKLFCNKILKNVKLAFDQSVVHKAKRNPKATWKAIQEIANINKKSSKATRLLTICKNNPVLSINAVNKYFSNIGQELANKNHPQTAPLSSVKSKSTTTLPHSMVLYSTSTEEILDIISSLKTESATGWDGIPTKLIKSLRTLFAPILEHIFNLALSSGVFPSAFKKALVHPIFKNGDSANVSNYRPISVLTVLSKILEKLLNVRLSKYLSDNNILSKNQFGFRKGVSTENALLQLTNTIVKSIEYKAKIIGIFLDLSKAFDTVSIPILISKLEKIGIRGIALDLFKSYLINRTQQVVINEHRSRSAEVNYGVPQGSVLGPTLFLIYINDLCNLSLPHCQIQTYADDTALLVTGKNWLETQIHAEQALRHVMTWLSLNRLTLNLSKTKFVPFSPSIRSSPLDSFRITAHSCHPITTNSFCSCTNIERASTLKYLGVILDTTMSWKNHIEYVVSQTRKLIYVFKNLNRVLDLDTLRTVYFALGQSIISYCITSWGGAAQSQMIKLERAQRTVLKVICKKPRLFPTTELYSLSHVLTVRQLFILHTVLLRHSQTPYDSTLTQTKRRSDKVCKTESHRTTLASRHFSFISTTLYNRLNKHLNIYPLTRYQSKIKCREWLLSLDYENTENLLKIVM